MSGPQTARRQALMAQSGSFAWPRSAILAAGAALLLYLCWRIVAPFLSAFCWAFALALVAEPLYAWLVRRSLSKTLSSLIVVILVVVIVAGPGALLVRALAREASGVVDRTADAGGMAALWRNAEDVTVIGPILRWLDYRFDLPQETLQIARSLAGWASGTLTAFVSGSMWLLSQIGITLFALFYFLRDGEVILDSLRRAVPLPEAGLHRAFLRIAEIIRISLGGKLVVASIQGALGGLMFLWLGIPGPVFWGSLMAVLSMFPVIGAFVVWFPAALFLGFHGDWLRAGLLSGWGLLIIHPVDNLLGPVLVGATLRLHTLLTFIGVLGGIAAFGAAGVVIGPVIIAIAISIFESDAVPAEVDAQPDAAAVSPKGAT